MATNDEGNTFKTTRWTMVRDAPHDPAALESFLSQYWSPVYAYLRRSGRRPDEAADHTQSFFAAILEKPRLLTAADPARGRFRTYLLSAVQRFLIDEHRRECGRNGQAPRQFSIDREALSTIEPSHADDPARAFDREWARTVLDQAIRRLEASCVKDNMTAQWSVFEQRVLRPASHGAAPAPIEDLMAELHVGSAQEVYSMLQTMKRRFHRALVAVVAQTVRNPDEAEQELADLLRVLAMPR
jgi:RNA polymerase sigma factor (sigma-70 family)